MKRPNKTSSSGSVEKARNKTDNSQEILAINLAKAMLKAKTREEVLTLKEWSTAEQWEAAQQLLNTEQRQAFVQIWNTQ